MRIRALRPHVVSDPFHQPAKHAVAGKAEDARQSVRLAPLHDLGTAVVAVTADRDARIGQWARMRRTRRRRWPRISLPLGVLPGRSTAATGRPFAAS